MKSVQFGLCSIRIIFFLSFFLFLLVFSLTDTNDSQNSREGRGSNYFSCFSLLLAHEHSFSSSNLFLSRSICNYQTDSWWDLHFIWTFIDAIKSELTLTFQSDMDRIWAHIKTSPFCWLIDVYGFSLSAATVNSVVSLQVSSVFSSMYNFSCERLCFTFSISPSRF